MKSVAHDVKTTGKLANDANATGLMFFIASGSIYDNPKPN